MHHIRRQDQIERVRELIITYVSHFRMNVQIPIMRKGVEFAYPSFRNVHRSYIETALGQKESIAPFATTQIENFGARSKV